jgi:hypothetical protein
VEGTQTSVAVWSAGAPSTGEADVYALIAEPAE